jgi:hypothetical protein
MQKIYALRIIYSAETMLRVWFGAESLFMTFCFVCESTENTKIPLKKNLFSLLSETSLFRYPFFHFGSSFFVFCLIFVAKYNLEYSFFGGEGTLSFLI